MSKKPFWAEPLTDVRKADCYFYHTMELPGEGTVEGEWDLRGTEASYLGHIPLKNKRVLEAGTASGHLCFYMERMGAEVVAYDLSAAQDWDLVPYSGYAYETYILERKKHMSRINKGFWFAHRANRSQAKVVYGTVYEPPAEMGSFDIVTFGSILLHLRDPFLALQRMCAHAKESVVVTDMMPAPNSDGADKRLIRFLPDAASMSPYETWWLLSPELVAEFLHILGFPHTQISYHEQICLGNRNLLYTVQGHRKPQTFHGPESPKPAEVQPAAAPNSAMDAASSQEKTSGTQKLGKVPYTVLLKHLLKRSLLAVPKRLFKR